jgi:hypothetical protein
LAAGTWQPVGRVVVEEFELLERQQLAVVLMWWTESGLLNHVALQCRESHTLDNILTSEEEPHGNAGTAWRRSCCRLAGPGTFVSDKQNKGLS